MPDLSDDERVENPDIPVTQTRQTVQNDLVLSTLRLPFRERLTLLINEFGTALAGNGENLNKAIRRGAPALEQTRKVTKLLASQNTTIRDLNVNSDRIIGRLAERRQDVVRFIEEAKNTAADRRHPPRRPLAELRPARRLPRPARPDDERARQPRRRREPRWPPICAVPRPG